MTYPVGGKPDGAWAWGSRYGQDITESSAKAQMTHGAKINWQGAQDEFRDNIQNPLGNKADIKAVPDGSPLWLTFTGNADATVPRIMLRNQISGASGGSHSHSFNGSVSGSSCSGSTSSASVNVTLTQATPDYKPAGNGANYTEIGFVECSRDRSYNAFIFGTGGAWTLLGIQAMYAVVYKMDASSGTLTQVARTNDIKGSVSSTNTEYAFALNNSFSAQKGDILGLGVLQVTGATQTTNSLWQHSFLGMSAPGGFKPAALYAYSQGSTVPLTSISYGSLTFNNSFVPYFAIA